MDGGDIAEMRSALEGYAVVANSFVIKASNQRRLIETLMHEKAELVAENAELMADIREWQDAHGRTQEQLNDLRLAAELDREALLEANREVAELRRERDEARMWYERSRKEVLRLDSRLKVSICRESDWIKAQKAALMATPEGVLRARVMQLEGQNRDLSHAVMAGVQREKSLRAAVDKAYSEMTETTLQFRAHVRAAADREHRFETMLSHLQANMAAFKEAAPGSKRARSGSIDLDDEDCAEFAEFLAQMAEEKRGGAGAGSAGGAAASSSSNA